MRKYSALRSALRLALWICLVAGALWAERVEAACSQIHLANMDPVDWRGASGGSYDVFDTSQQVQAVEIRVRKTGGGSCRYAIGISEGYSGTFNPRQLVRRGEKLAYNLHDSAAQTNVLMDLALGGSVIEGVFTNSEADLETNTHTYYWIIPPMQVISGANSWYQDRPRFRLHEEVGGVFVQRHSGTKHHRARASRMVEVSLVDAGAPFNSADISQQLDFGVFFAGQSLRFDLRARGNTSFDVSLQSVNAGVMAHSSLPSAVPYTLEVDGIPVDLASGAEVPIASFSGDATGVDGVGYRVAVTIGSLSGTLGGLHRDSITVTVTAQ
jgi:spore coat protein U-like protein